MTGISLTLLLSAIAAIETGAHAAKDYAAIGRDGERSRWQISAEVWAEHSAQPFAVASAPDQVEARRVAEAHVIALYRRLEREAGLLPTEVTVEHLSYGWNAGGGAMVNRARSAKVAGRPFHASDYAQRVANLYHDAEFALKHSSLSVP